MTHGAIPSVDGNCTFRVWAPQLEGLAVHLLDDGRVVPLRPVERGYHEATVNGVGHGARYLVRLPDGRELPDPASRWQPEGVHGPSAVVDLRALRPIGGCGKRAIRQSDLAIMEIHIGTFSAAGTFEGAIEHLADLVELGVNAVEIMPVAQFPGARNWGYDGVFPFAAQDTYGGPEGLVRLVEAIHDAGMEAILDVVYNHLGPEGNVLGDFGPYFTERYRTPWGQAVNVDGPDSDEVRRYFIDNALMWLEEYGFDGLRLDAIHGIFDMSARPFLAQLTEEVEARCPGALLIAESESNDPRVVRPRARGGLGMHAQWSDDFHHAVHTLVTGERDGYYADYGEMRHLARALTEGFVYQGEYSPYRRRSHGAPATNLPAERLVVCIQNHDQVGNRMRGERLSALVEPDRLRVAAMLLLTAPDVPLLFMGEEYAETAPFLYFVSHTDAELVEAVRKGRAEEFASFGWQEEPPDPADEKTFLRSKLDRGLARDGHHRELRALYRSLLQLRRERPALATPDRAAIEATADESARTIVVRRWHDGDEVVIAANLGDGAATVELPDRSWDVLAATRDIAVDQPSVQLPAWTGVVVGVHR